MILKCCLLISLKIVLFLCNYLQMVISSSESIANVQHLPRIFSPLVTLDCNHLQAEETFFCFALHPWCWPINSLLLFLWWGSCLILWEAPEICKFPLFHLLISPNSHIYLVWSKCVLLSCSPVPWREQCFTKHRIFWLKVLSDFIWLKIPILQAAPS